MVLTSEGNLEQQTQHIDLLLLGLWPASQLEKNSNWQLYETLKLASNVSMWYWLGFSKHGFEGVVVQRALGS
jgi:hypothetical protein